MGSYNTKPVSAQNQNVQSSHSNQDEVLAMLSARYPSSPHKQSKLTAGKIPKSPKGDKENEEAKEEDEENSNKKNSIFSKFSPNVRFHKKRRKFLHVPEHAEQRAKLRKEAAIGGNQKKRGNRGVQEVAEARKKKVWKFKNFYNEDLSGGNAYVLKSSLKMLDTDELMGYYKELLSKSRKDLIAHHRKRNLIKRLEYL